MFDIGKPVYEKLQKQVLLKHVKILCSNAITPKYHWS